METKFIIMHHIDVENQKIMYKNVEGDANEYITDLTREILDNESRRKYEVDRESTEVISQVIQVAKEKELKEENKDKIAERLLSKEIEVQRKVEKLNVKIKKGSLIQSFFEMENKYYYLISKVDSDAFLDETDLLKKFGLRYEDKAFKNCLIEFNNSAEIINIFISDKNSGGTLYWHDAFLELDEVVTDEKNTEEIFEMAEFILKRQLKDNSSELTLHRNALLGYFKTSESFSIDDCIDYVFGSEYNEDVVNVARFKQTLTRKIEIAKLDTQFNIKKEAIKSRKWKETKLVNKHVNIIVDGYIEQIQESVFSVEEEGERYIKIHVTEDGTFDSFNWK